MNLRLSTAPHVHNPVTTQRLMLYVLIALLPTAAFGVYAFGVPALIILLVSMASAVLAEFLWQKIARQPVRVGDLSALLTGLILGLNLPANAPWWLAVIGSVFAVIIVKQLFGGLGDNFLNPAMAARAVLLASWPVHMTTYVAPTFFKAGVDAVATATPLVMKDASLMSLFMGNIPGTIGEVSKIAILVGFLFLLVTKTISWHIPVSMVGGVFVFSWLFGADPVMAILSGGVLFGAVFMATDYVTSPMTPWGRIIYGLGIGLIISLIRQFGAYPEGVTYGILLMNIATPLIDRFLPRKIYGHQKEAKKA
ncbi:MAG: RnfABCDGE type electron transport complex subunit D [Clostridia bacterium]|nr:RnfABCDGE type electron transport complex subunit D [Clostridia bacterium]MBQ6804488.1 RnfABCDGE type electron transport complex subunit D [Clostridia bacterium]MDD6682757.1 RnfABCDGE type electron transport complex subunit D [Clostridiales bacterium]